MYTSILLAVVVVFCSNSLSATFVHQYNVVSQRALQGWSYELTTINRLQCLLACSRKILCLSVNYNKQSKVCQLSNRRRRDKIESFKEDTNFEYYEKILNAYETYGVHVASTNVTYDEAQRICKDHLGSLATYENIYHAFGPRMDNCIEGWLISGEIAFTEETATDKCVLKKPNKRSNLFPCRPKTYYSGYYCYANYSQVRQHISESQQIIRLTGNNAKKLNANASDVCCKIFGGRLATPFEVFKVSATHVGLCVTAWLSHGLAGNACYGGQLNTWIFPGWILFDYPMKEFFAMCYIPFPDENLTFPNPFPDHEVIHVQGIEPYSLTYQEAKARCIGHGGVLATKAQVEFANTLGYSLCRAGWIKSGEVIYPMTQSHPDCGNTIGIISWSYPTRSNNMYGGYCYIINIP
ncbi:uncharacterized protein [Antedon mediterranea]|uniref:uncharacterized protein n=1 Tax=Antedon mediterranea TaxID=105859 RepID=UPI003AF7085E